MSESFGMLSPLLIAAQDSEPVDWTTPIALVAALVLVFVNGFFVLAEFAIVKVRATRIEELVRSGHPRAQLAKHVITHLDAYLSATQLGVTMASLGLGWVAEPAFARIVNAAVGNLGWSSTTRHTISAIVAFGIITFLHILVGELAPKCMAIREPERYTLALAWPLQWIYRIFYVPMWLLNGAANTLLRWLGIDSGNVEKAHTEQELRVLLSTAQTTGGFTLNRLLILENIFDLGTQTVREAMIPWANVHYVSRSASLPQILRTITETRFSRYPVVETSGLPRTYLLMKDLIVQQSGEQDWTRILRPLPQVKPDESLEATMQRLQGDGTNMAVVVENNKPVGIITLEDILEEVVGRIEDEYPRLPRLYLKDALADGGVILHLQAETADEAIEELAKTIPTDRLPDGADVLSLALARERQMPTDVGRGVAIPHARCPGLAKSILVLGRSEGGLVFNAQTGDRVRLVFLLITPAERPQTQVFFLTQLASIAQSEFVRERLVRAQSAEEIVQIIAAADPAVTG
ncbi:MAG: Hemolysin [Planctomycetota bacterium]|jgi:CBS domain containing-hemolysin-like protein